MRGPTHLHARIGGPAAHNGPRHPDDPAERVPPAVAAPPGPERAAHTACNVVIEAVFHAPMFALNADAELNACEPSHPRSTPTEGARMCRRGCVRAQSHTHTRAHGRSTCARVCGWPAPAIRSSV